MFLLLASLASFAQESEVVDSRSALTDVTVWDAVEGLREVEAIVIDGDRIVSVGSLPPGLDASRVRDMAGATVLPGLMDLHVHLSLIPSGAFRDDDREATARHHLAAYVACGVTTVLDTGIPAADAHMISRLATEGPSPDLHMLGPLVSPPGGYVSVVLPEFPPAATAEDVREQFEAFDDLSPFGVKATVEEGMITRVWPLYSTEVSDAIFEQAAARDIGVYAHAMSAKEYRLALDLGVAGFVHPTQSPRGRLVRELADKKLWVISTLSVFDALLVESDQARLDHPVMTRVVPPAQLASARDPEIWERYKDSVIASMLPGRTGLTSRFLRSMLDKPGLVHGRLGRMQRSVYKQFSAGVPIVVGSDSGNWPVFPSEFHGPTTLREIELLVDAGFTPEEALTAATLTPAQMLGLEAEVGTIAAGMRADLLVVEGDVTEDISAVWDAIWVVRNGIGNTPDGWMGAR